jgi:PAS domain S-box-containing protein
VTARHEALRESEERFRTLVELSPDGICVIRNGLIAFANTRLAAILGRRDPQELLGSPASDLLPTVADAPQAEGRGEAEPSSFAALTEAQLKRPDGSLVAVEITAAPVHFDGAHGLQVVVRDVSDRKRLEAQLQHAQKMELVGRLAGGRTISTTSSRAPQHPELFRLRAGSAGPHRLRRDQAQSSAVEPSPVSCRCSGPRRRLRWTRPAALVADNATFLTRLLPVNVAFEVQAVPGTVPVFGDPGQLEQVLVNLVVNAQDAMPDGGTITLGCGVQTSGWPYFSVTDTGVGIAPAVLDRIFEPFFTTKPRGKGTGLGLAVVKGIVDHHQGWLQVDSQPGNGTTMTVILPPRDATARSSAKPPHSPAGMKPAARPLPVTKGEPG